MRIHDLLREWKRFLSVRRLRPSQMITWLQITLYVRPQHNTAMASSEFKWRPPPLCYSANQNSNDMLLKLLECSLTIVTEYTWWSCCIYHARSSIRCKECAIYLFFQRVPATFSGYSTDNHTSPDNFSFNLCHKKSCYFQPF